jgi:hypothetical protein
MKPPRIVGLLVVLLLGAAAPSGRPAEEPRVGSQIHPGIVSIWGESLVGVMATPIYRLRLLAIGEEGYARPIPFQIDERDSRGIHVLKGADAKLVTPVSADDSDHGLFDENDELVFALADAGARATARETFLDPVKLLEIELTDGKKKPAWVYLAAYRQSPPPPAIETIRYDETSDTVQTELYAVSYRAGQAEPTPAGLQLLGGDGLSILDRFKLHAVGPTTAEPARRLAITQTEGRFAGYRAGPVRVIRRTESDFVVPGLGKVTTEWETHFFRDGFAWRGRIGRPASAAESKVVWQLGFDLNSAAAGMRCAVAGQDFLIDGRPDGNVSPLVTAPGGAAAYTGHRMSFVAFPDPLSASPPRRQYFLDDAQAETGADGEPGAWGQSWWEWDAPAGKGSPAFELGLALMFRRGSINRAEMPEIVGRQPAVRLSVWESPGL